MEEIRAIPWNGYDVVSTFSGCGGSCLGYRMAGFRILWANEFVPAAQASYEANKDRACILDKRDIRSVQPEEILSAIGKTKGEIDLFDGSPPCASFSTAGKRVKGWGKIKPYSDTKQRVDDLFFEYTRLLKGLQPRVFVAENVSGLVKGVAKGMFLEILAALKECGYRVKCKVLDAQWLGVPQMRQRTIFVGVREDLGIEPAHPNPLPYRYSVRDALPWINEIRQKGVYDEGDRVTRDAPSPSVTVEGPGAKRRDVVSCVIHDTGGQKETRYVKHKDVTDQPCPTITNGINGINSCHFKVETSLPEDARPCRAVTTDDSFGSCGVVKRKFTIEELKRICAFPDDFVLTGTYAQQWERLGRAVPPLMMRAVAETIRDEILQRAPA